MIDEAALDRFLARHADEMGQLTKEEQVHVRKLLGCLFDVDPLVNKYPSLHTIMMQQRVRIAELEDLLTSAHAIAKRHGEDTHWGRFSDRLTRASIGYITAKTFRKLPSDQEIEREAIAILEGRPVYAGDILFDITGARFRAEKSNHKDYQLNMRAIGVEPDRNFWLTNTHVHNCIQVLFWESPEKEKLVEQIHAADARLASYEKDLGDKNDKQTS